MERKNDKSLGSLEDVLVQNFKPVTHFRGQEHTLKLWKSKMSLTDLNRVQIGSRKQTADEHKKGGSSPAEKDGNNFAIFKK